VYSQVTTDDGDYFNPLHLSQVKPMMSNPGLYPVDAVGFGLTSVHRRVFEKWDQNIPMFEGSELGHDMQFCRAARRLGFTVHADTAIHCGHLSEVAHTFQDALNAEQQGEK
jgi:hypothetical protein